MGRFGMERVTWWSTAAVAAWSWATMAAYWGEPDISQLNGVAAWLTPDMWSWAWGVVALVLTVGLLPIPHAVNFRTIGLLGVATLCAAWAASFFMAGGRGWVSGKNYVLFSVAAALFAVLVALVEPVKGAADDRGASNSD